MKPRRGARRQPCSPPARSPPAPPAARGRCHGYGHASLGEMHLLLQPAEPRGGEGTASPPPPPHRSPPSPCPPPGPSAESESHRGRAGSARGVPFLRHRGAGGPGDTFGFAQRQRGILFLAIKQSRPGTAGIKGRRGFLMESCRQSQRCRDSPSRLRSRLPPHSTPRRGPSPCPIPPAWDFGQRVFPAPQDLPGATATPGGTAPAQQPGSSGGGSSHEQVNGIDASRFLTGL